MRNIPSATRNLIIINVLVFVMCYLNENFMYGHFALFSATSPYFRIWQLLTHMFMHGGIWHIFFNMYTLMIFGSVLERQWGARKFLTFYFVTGIGAAALHMGVQAIQALVFTSQGASHALAILNSTPTVGASGAIYGLLIGYAMLYPDSVMTLIFPPISLKAKWFVLIFAAIELFTGLGSVTSMAGGIAHFAHLGGMLFGWLLMLLWKKQHRMYTYE
ncbi:MAG: rhomboid family intramembrane serine protease [Bacteroidales bacterium]|nr:rhomboid family intramembrane serine protease [Bacteroidales bacterium]